VDSPIVNEENHGNLKSNRTHSRTLKSGDFRIQNLTPRYGYLRKERQNCDRLCGLVVRVLGYRSGGPGSIPGTTAVGIRHVDHVAPLYPQKLAITLPTSGSRSVGIVCSRTQTMEFSLGV
jgi:hypothetical protein